MNYVLEFGNRGGLHTSNQIINSKKCAMQLAKSLVMVFSNNHPSFDFNVSKSNPRISWSSSTHFVSLSVLDDIPRGSASSTLWKIERGENV